MAACSKENELPVKPIIIAHRGVYSDEPENSVQGFDNCLNNGITSVEIDVFLTKDDSVLIIHDLNTERLSGLPGKVDDYTAGQLKAAIFKETGGRSLTFNEFFNMYHDKFENVFIDFKLGQNDEKIYKMVTQIIDAVSDKKSSCRFFAASTNIYPHQINTSLQGPLINVLETSDTKDYINSGLDYSYLLIGQTNLNNEDLHILKEKGVKIISFTSNSIIEFDISISNGCYAIMTNNPGLLKDYLEKLDFK
jgi:glycerophosphoryl diester phosphodiesterase